jgi:toxin ParE1/3/4
LLTRSPEIGRQRGDLREGLRSFPVGNYRVYYTQAKRGVVEIVGVRHAAQDERRLFN